MPTIPTPAAGSWSARSATSPPSTTPCNARRALAALNQQLAQADTLDDAVCAAAEELRGLWRARRVLAATWPPTTSEPVAPQSCASASRRHWADLPSRHQADDQVAGRGRSARSPTRHSRARRASRCSIPGACSWCTSSWPSGGRSPPRTRRCSRCWPAASARVCSGCINSTSSGKRRWRCRTRSSGPAQLPSGFAVRYQPATRPLQVGGDWYDVVDLDDGRIALIVGDCVGHGLAAATVMGQLRSACRALLLEQPSPAAALSALDRFAARLPGARVHHRLLRGARLRHRRTGVLQCRPSAADPGHGRPHHPAARRRSRHTARAVLRPVPPRGPRDACRRGRPCCSTPTVWSSVVAKRWTRHRPRRRPRPGQPRPLPGDLARDHVAAGAERRLSGRRRAAAVPPARAARGRVSRRRKPSRRYPRRAARLAGTRRAWMPNRH